MQFENHCEKQREEAVEAHEIGSWAVEALRTSRNDV